MKSESLWRDYFFLTEELEKFIKQEDFSMVESLLVQREQLQQAIDGSGAKGVLLEKSQLQKIEATNRAMIRFLQQAQFTMQRQRQASNAYEKNVAAYHGHLR